MAAEFNAGVITTKGLALLAKWQAGRCTPTLTRAVVGSGSYSSGESLVNRTALKSQKLSVGFSTKQVQNASTLLLRFVFDNTTLTTGFKVTEVGVYANDPDDGEILYSIATSADAANADYLPAYNGTYPSTIVFNYQIEVANAANVTIRAGTGAYALADDFYETQADVEVLKGNDQDVELAVRVLSEYLSLQTDDLSEKVEDLQVAAALLATNSALHENRLDEQEETEADHYAAIQKHLAVETGTVILTNSKAYPFNSTVTTPVNVALTTRRDATDYIVEAEVTAYSGGLPGEIQVSGKLVNSFKLSFTGSATSVTVKYKVRGGITL